MVLIEVEKKAWIEDAEAMEKKLSQAGKELGLIDFRDTYFTCSHVTGYTNQRFRLREYSGGALVTAKEQMEGRGAEVSLEHEFEVDDPEAFRCFAKMFGFKVLIEKKKRGKRFLLGSGKEARERGPFAELVEVEGLGAFLEIEVMASDSSKVDEARAKVDRALSDLGVAGESVEARPYTLMLYEKKYGRGDA